MEKSSGRFFASSVGQKFVMALTGAFLIVFLIAHLLGNLEIYAGQDAMNSYAAFLRSVPKALWTLRILLIVSFVVHITVSIKLSIQNKKARPIPYTKKEVVAATLASRTMLLSGLLVLSFLLFHLSHLTWGFVHPEYAELLDPQGRHDVYTMTVLGFRDPLTSALYVVAQCFLFLHVSHGFSSAAQTVGLTSCSGATLLRTGGKLFALVLTALYISIPISVFLGFVQLP